MSDLDEAPVETTAHFGLLVDEELTTDEMEGVSYPTLADAAERAVQHVGPHGDADSVLIIRLDADDADPPKLHAYEQQARVVRVAPRVPADG